MIGSAALGLLRGARHGPDWPLRGDEFSAVDVSSGSAASVRRVLMPSFSRAGRSAVSYHPRTTVIEVDQPFTQKIAKACFLQPPTFGDQTPTTADSLEATVDRLQRRIGGGRDFEFAKALVHRG
ncbi:MAG: hypothetical protein JF606_15460 [Burkholderiales bacterium]|jgi:hypothetical protein|nr:hypothetical protein [Burkholderiales bacterium]